MSVGKKTPPEGVAASVFFCRTQSLIPRDTYCFAWAGLLPGKPSKGRIDMQLQRQTAAAASHKLPGAYIILLGGLYDGLVMTVFSGKQPRQFQNLLPQ